MGRFHHPQMGAGSVLNFVSLRKPVRCLPVISLAAVFLTIVPVAQASMSCRRVENYDPVSDSLIMQQIETHLQSMPAFKNRQIRQMNSRFAIAWQDEEECRKVFRCHYLLLDVRDNAVKDVFAFRGTGTVWTLGSPIAVWSDPLHDDYSLKAFESDSYDYLEVRLPRRGGPVWIGGSTPEDTKMLQKLCGAYKYK